MKTQSASPLRLADVTAARARLAHGLRLTPCHAAPALTAPAGAAIWLKRDDLHRTGSFKERGARHALLCLDAAQRARGVVAASAGNHALGLAYHGAQLGVRVTVVMARTAPEVKSARCRALGAAVVLHGENFEAAHAHAVELARESGAAFVHPFDDAAVMAGQGTLALELLEQAPEFDAIVLPVGGGGLLAGVATVIKALRPHVRVVAAEPEAAASFAAAWRAGGVVSASAGKTIADGLAVARVGEGTFRVAMGLVDEVVTVKEDELAAGVVALAQHCGAVVEGAGACGLAAVLAGKVRGRTIAVPITGRNIEPRVHAEVLARAREGGALVTAAIAA